MKPRDPQERGRAALLAAVERYAQERANEAARGPEPWPGDLYVLEETAGWPVEWLVVERAPGGCRVVAADAHPVLGAADVSVPAASAGGPLSVRCSVSFEVDVATLRRGGRSGTVAPDILETVRRRLQELAAGASDPRLGQGGEPDPELEDWVDDVLAPARGALLPVRLDAPGSPHRFGFRAAGAAFLLLLIALGGVSALAWRFHREAIQARHEVERLLHEPSAPPAPIVNLAYANFYPGATRGTTRAPREIAAPAAATHFFLVFFVGHQAPCAGYEIEIARRGAPEAPFTVRDLRPLPGHQEVSVALPRAQVPDGTYQLRLYGLCGTERRALGDYGARLSTSP
ncbi:MAG TPA: hypothetical protein VGE98_01380 [Thermoanaerobaculia bacterium]